MDKLRQVIQEELSNILQSVEQTEQELERRNRNDRLQKREKKSGDRWYKTESGSGDVKDKLRQIVVEEYETLRDEPETSIEHRSGLRDFEVPEGTSGRWYTDDRGNVDSEKIEEAARLLTKKKLAEKKLDRLIEQDNRQLRELLVEIASLAVKDVLRLRDIKLNPHSVDSGGQIEFANDADDRGFFLNMKPRDRAVAEVEVVGRGREYGESGTKVTLDLEKEEMKSARKLADAIEEEPLEETAVEPMPGRGQAPRRY